MTTQSILIIDDDPDMSEFVSVAAGQMGWSSTATQDVSSFLLQDTENADMIFLDLTMPGIEGLELLRELGRRECRTAIVLMSGVGQAELAEAQDVAQSVGLTVFASLRKPFSLASLEMLIARRVSARRLEKSLGHVM